MSTESLCKVCIMMEIGYVVVVPVYVTYMYMGTCMYTATCSVDSTSVFPTHHVVGILRKFDDMVEVILPQLPTSFEAIVDPEGKAALIWILGEYGEVPHTLP